MNGLLVVWFAAGAAGCRKAVMRKHGHFGIEIADARNSNLAFAAAHGFSEIGFAHHATPSTCAAASGTFQLSNAPIT